MKYLNVIIIFFLFFTSSKVVGQNNTFENEVLSKCIHGQSISNVTNFEINLTHEKTISDDGCLVVKETNEIPSKTKDRIVKITVHPGYCSRDDSWDDCSHDRSRVEFYDKQGVQSGNKVIYEYSMYIPEKVDLLQNGNPTVFLGQLNSVSDKLYSSLVMLTYQKKYDLHFQTYDKFNWYISKRTFLNEKIPKFEMYDKWISIKYEVDVFPDERGKLKIYVNNSKIFERLNHPTIKEGGRVQLKMGIYNNGITLMRKPRSSQIIFFDDIKRKILSY